MSLPLPASTEKHFLLRLLQNLAVAVFDKLRTGFAACLSLADNGREPAA